ncbi:hypothetical protein [Microbacterium radiodurans]|uniref:Integral membrane protein n=1 Tax=Microbacterium radiodurans TaxID=661398 RepID=A0A5J5ISI4_9MICO|nr:hypothetical protein [Microbacterium radiodurans]KAA9085314.1 hypothetical protein F6B42_12645 [Microbacterium radiodurans]
MQKWWERIAAASATTPFGVVVMQAVLWVVMSILWISWSVGEVDPIRLVLAIISPLLVFYWVVALLVALQRRRAEKAD